MQLILVVMQISVMSFSSHGAALLAGLVLLAGCAPPPEGRFEPTRPIDDAAPAELVPTSRFDGVVADAAPDAERLEADAQALLERAEKLRRETEGLTGSVIDPETRARLEAARGG